LHMSEAVADVVWGYMGKTNHDRLLRGLQAGYRRTGHGRMGTGFGEDERGRRGGGRSSRNGGGTRRD
jgi:hypothetical protein